MADSDIASSVARKYLRLHLCRGIGAIRFSNLLSEIGDVEAVLGASVSRLASVNQIGPHTAEQIARQRDQIDIEDELQRAQRAGVRVLCLADADYPVLLKRINDPPACLYYRGTLEREDAVSLAIVGSRHSSHYGGEQSERFGALAAGVGLTVVSGMARGIDACAHRGALSAGGRTLAVLGCGLGHLYPPESTELADRISSGGALISELPMDTAPDAKNFPPRNRIIAGLSLGVLVVEAARRSGALISARLANEYNREVFAIPGRIDMPHSEGCHRLIQVGGAKLVTRLEDILEELGDAGAVLMSPDHDSEESGQNTDSTKTFVSLTKNEEDVLQALEGEPIPIESICEISGILPGAVATALTGLQLKGVVRRVGGNLFDRTRQKHP